jgi:rSAM/selenodomain-associated transferase 1
VQANLIILFAKSPVPGNVKTRLASALSAELAAELHRAFVETMIDRFRALKDTDFELHTDTRNDAWGETGVTRKPQILGDLGLRMIHALQQSLDHGYERAVILGSDAPTLPVDHVMRLLSSNADIALGPAEDGGFYAIAARRTNIRMFDEVSWSQSTTLADTLKSIEHAGLTVDLGPRWFDVDTVADLRRLAEQPDLSPEMAGFVKRSLSDIS